MAVPLAAEREPLAALHERNMTKTKTRNEVMFRVALKGRRVWRTIAMRGDHTLEQLHEEIFHAFDRFDDHLYSFYLPKAPRRRGALVRSREYVSPWSFEESEATDRTFNAASTTIDALNLKVGQTFEYLFDYGDSWWHQIEIVHFGPIVAGRRYPTILETHGRSPKQYPDVE